MGPLAERIMLILERNNGALKNFFVKDEQPPELRKLRRLFTNDHDGDPLLDQKARVIFEKAVNEISSKLTDVTPTIDSKAIANVDKIFNSAIKNVMENLTQDTEWIKFFSSLTTDKQKHLTKSIEDSIILQFTGDLRKVSGLAGPMIVYLTRIALNRNLSIDKCIADLNNRENLVKQDSDVKNNFSSVYKSLTTPKTNNTVFHSSVVAASGLPAESKKKLPDLLTEVQEFKTTTAKQLHAEAIKKGFSTEVTDPYKKLNDALEGTLLVLRSYVAKTDNRERIETLLTIKNSLADTIKSGNKNPEESTKQLQDALKNAYTSIYQEEKRKFLGTLRARNSTLLKSIEAELKKQGVPLPNKSSSISSFSNFFIQLKENSRSPTLESTKSFLKRHFGPGKK